MNLVSLHEDLFMLITKNTIMYLCVGINLNFWHFLIRFYTNRKEKKKKLNPDLPLLVSLSDTKVQTTTYEILNTFNSQHVNVTMSVQGLKSI